MSEEEIENIASVTWDHTYFYVDGEKFLPSFLEDGTGNTVIIPIPYPLEKENVEEIIATASAASYQGKRILWEFNFEFDKKPLFIQDSALFFSYGLRIREFVEKVYTKFKENTLGAVLFRGGVDFSSYFVFTEEHERLYAEYAEEFPLLGKKESSAFFAADVFVQYLQRLCSFFPDDLAAVCLLDMSFVESGAFAAYLTSKERFGYLLPGIKNGKVPGGYLVWEEGKLSGRGEEAKIGVCLPTLQAVSETAMGLIEELLSRLIEKGVNFRVLPEENLHESWDGIDDLIVISSLLSSQGMRKLRGFVAAGGRIVGVEGPVGIEGEAVFSDCF